MSINTFFPKATPRPQQAEVMTRLEAGWDSHDVFVIQAPTATGKEALAVTIAKWQASFGKKTTICAPTNILVNQIAGNYPELATLHRKDAYNCEELGASCVTIQKDCGQPCDGCVYSKSRKNFVDSNTRVCNTYIYLSNKSFSEVVVMDEAHQLIKILQDLESSSIWGNRYKFPRNLRTTSDLLEWIETQKRDEHLLEIRAELLKHHNQHMIEYTNDFYRGALVPVLKVRPIKIRAIRQQLWPQHKVHKLILMSATISKQLIYEMGLDRRRVLYIDVDSPIPPVNRPTIYDPAANVTYQYKERACGLLAAYIDKKLVMHPEKGLIHLPYSWVADVLRHTKNPRLMTHSKVDKAEVLSRFRASSNGVLIASGMFEGVDLPLDDARWQIIGKVPFDSLGDPAIAERASTDPEWYAYAAILKVVQAAGRVCRAPDDHGITYIADSQFERLYRNHKKLFPAYFVQALRGING